MYLIISVSLNRGAAVFQILQFLHGKPCALIPGLGFLEDGLDVRLPVGISFYTFQIMSYTIDVYRGDAR